MRMNKNGNENRKSGWYMIYNTGFIPRISYWDLDELMWKHNPHDKYSDKNAHSDDIIGECVSPHAFPTGPKDEKCEGCETLKKRVENQKKKMLELKKEARDLKATADENYKKFMDALPDED